MNRPRTQPGSELVAASLLTSPTGCEVHLVTRGGLRHRLALESPIADLLALSLWRGIEAERATDEGPAPRRGRTR